jgi:hypothetical protein
VTATAAIASGVTGSAEAGVTGTMRRMSSRVPIARTASTARNAATGGTGAGATGSGATATGMSVTGRSRYRTFGHTRQTLGPAGVPIAVLIMIVLIERATSRAAPDGC